MKPFFQVEDLPPTLPFHAGRSADHCQESSTRLKQDWNQVTAKFALSLKQGSRIENLAWRRWHMDRRHGFHLGDDQDPMRHLDSSLGQLDRTSILGEQSSSSLAAFESAGSEMDVLNGLLGLGATGDPGQQHVQPLLQAPQPLPPPPMPPAPLDFSSSWSTGPPPSSIPPGNRIIATPSWTALFADPVPQTGPAQSAGNGNSNGNGSNGPDHFFHSNSTPNQNVFSPDSMPMPPVINNAGINVPSLGSGGNYPFAPFGALTTSSAALFALPPNASLFPDLNSSLATSTSSAAQGGALGPSSFDNGTTAPPSAFYSSYGWYQPVVGPYPRFLTPSPEPEPLPDFTAFGGSTTTKASGDNGVAEGDATANSNRDFFAGMSLDGQEHGPSHVGSVASASRDSSRAQSPAYGGPADDSHGSKRVKSEWAALSDDEQAEAQAQAEMANRFDSYNSVEGTNNGNGSARGTGKVAGVKRARSSKKGSSTATTNQGSSGGGDVGDGGTKLPPKKRGRPKGSTKAAKEAALLAAAAAAAAAAGHVAPSTSLSQQQLPSDSELGSGQASLSKKNRNPHATRLPGSGPVSVDGADDGQNGVGPSPQCTHCGSVTTPLWRRGPDDELLCNACGLYQKLHQKPRPKAFATQANSAKRSQNGAAAQAAASGVPPSCSNCGATSTPMWRKDANGNLCCNACSLYYKLHNVVRPASLSQKRKNLNTTVAVSAGTGATAPKKAIVPTASHTSGGSGTIGAGSAGTSPQEQQQQQHHHYQQQQQQQQQAYAATSNVDHETAHHSHTHSQPSSTTNSTAASPLEMDSLQQQHQPPILGLPRPLSPRPPSFPPTFTQHLVQQEHQQWGFSPSAPQLGLTGVSEQPSSGSAPTHHQPPARYNAGSPGALRGGWALPPPPPDLSGTGAGPGTSTPGSLSARPMSPFSVSNDRSTTVDEGTGDLDNRNSSNTYQQAQYGLQQAAAAKRLVATSGRGHEPDRSPHVQHSQLGRSAGLNPAPIPPQTYYI